MLRVKYICVICIINDKQKDVHKPSFKGVAADNLDNIITMTNQKSENVCPSIYDVE